MLRTGNWRVRKNRTLTHHPLPGTHLESFGFQVKAADGTSVRPPLHSGELVTKPAGFQKDVIDLTGGKQTCPKLTIPRN